MPSDIVAVWGDDSFAREAVAAWGVDGFRGSRLHQLAVLEAGRKPRPRLRPDPKRK